MTLGESVANHILQLAGSSSTGKCAKVVREAVQKALGKPVVATGIESAKDYGPWLTNHGCYETDSTAANADIGDIAVMEASPGHPHGHIQVKTGASQWTSDFVQRSFYPYKDGSQPNYVVYSPFN